MDVLRIIVILSTLILGALAYTKDYTGYEVLRIFYRNQKEESVINNLIKDGKLRLHLWGEAKEGSIDVQVRPAAQKHVTDTLTKQGIKYQVDIPNIQAEIDRESKEEAEAEIKQRLHRRRLARSTRHRSPKEKASQTFHNLTIVGEYATFPKMREWFQAARRLYPHMIKIETIGHTTENRPMEVLKIGVGQCSRKPIIYLDANIHAREWVTSATAIYIINKLLTQYGKDLNVTMLLDHYNWYIVPVANPDGFVYSHTTDRLWRKTRSRVSDECYGVDPNRNWDYHWMDCCAFNPNRTCRTLWDRWSCASQNPCDDVYGGPRAFSEPETKAMSDFLLRIKEGVKMYMSFHCYSQLWLNPWGYTRDQPKYNDELERVAAIGAKALESVHGTKFRIGSPAHLLYSTAGGSYDWAKGVAGIKYSYTLELRDKGQHGFLLPKDQLVPTGEEVWAAVQVVATDLMIDRPEVTPSVSVSNTPDPPSAEQKLGSPSDGDQSNGKEPPSSSQDKGSSAENSQGKGPSGSGQVPDGAIF